MKRYAARYVYTLQGGRITPMENAFVETEDDGTVVRTGRCEEGDPDILPGAICPGFVNAHCHVELSYMKGLFRKGTGMTGFIDQINALRDTSPLEKKKEDIRYWMDRMYHRGVVAMADISNCDDSFENKASSPMYTRTFLEVFGTEEKDCEAVISSVLALKRKGEEWGLDCAPTPHACYTMSPSLVTRSSEEGLRSGFLSFHSEETPEEEDMIRFGKGPMWDNRRAAGMSTPPVTGGSSLEYFISRLEKIHPAPFGENILLVHEVCMDKEGMDLVKEKLPGAYIALCPLSNIFIHNALAPVPLMVECGMRLTVGTDSLSSNDDLDMISEIRCLQGHFSLPLGQILLWACSNGAAFLGKDSSLGSIEKGKRPGIVYIEGVGPDGLLEEGCTSTLLDPQVGHNR